MPAKRFSALLQAAVVVALLVFLLGAYVAVKLLGSKAQDVRNARLKSMVLEEKQNQLGKARSDIQKFVQLADIAKSIVPQDKDQARTVREIVRLAEKNGIKLGAITFPASSLGDKKSKQSQLVAEKGIPGVYSLEITVQSDVESPAPFANFLKFLDALEHNRRTALVIGINIQPDAADGSKTSFVITLKEYIKP
jgi:hypothetical protein